MTGKERLTILDREYWQSPVHVFTGVTWLLIGTVFGTLLAAAVL